MKMWENMGNYGKLWNPNFWTWSLMVWFTKAPSNQACYGLSEIGFTTHEMTTGTSAPGDTADT